MPHQGFLIVTVSSSSLAGCALLVRNSANYNHYQYTKIGDVKQRVEYVQKENLLTMSYTNNITHIYPVVYGVTFKFQLCLLV